MKNTTARILNKADLSLEHLQAELFRIDLSIQREIRRWRLAGQDPTDSFRGLYISETEADALLARPLGSNWGQLAQLSPAETETFAQAQAEAIRQTQKLVEAAQNQGHSLRLVELASTFDLSPFDIDALLICLAPTLDLRYERLYGYLQDDVTRKRPTINLVLDLLTEPGLSRLKYLSHFTDDAPLFKYRLLERNSDSAGDYGSPLSQSLRVDRAVVAWLLGRYQPHADLAAQARLLPLPPQPGQDDILLAGPAYQHLAQIVQAETSPLAVFYGPDSASQNAAARVLAALVGRPLLMVNLAALVKTELSPDSALSLALRDARLVGALPYLHGWDSCLTPEGQLPSGLLDKLFNYPYLAIVAGQTRWQAQGLHRERMLFELEFPIPAYAHRLELWQHFLETSKFATDQTNQSKIQNTQGALRPKSKIELSALAGQFALTTSQIRDTVASARDRAAQRHDKLNVDDLFVAARAHSNPRLASLARKINPRYVWADIILPADQLAILREIVATVRGRPQVLEQWGVGQKLASSAAVTVLFAGDPGTGKTMAAEVIANELNLDLYKIDLSTVVSKYIGETEKNLEKIFGEAESSNAILFFDEADAIFGKRSEVKDAHDRYANIEISYLLQRMEAYDGVTILATNLRANLDEAFTRRLQFAVDFPFPDQQHRRQIWQTLFPPTVPHDAEINFDILARRFKLAGGNIRNIIVSAAYLAAADGGRVTMEHLLHGTRRELQKMGRLIGEEDLRIE